MSRVHDTDETEDASASQLKDIDRENYRETCIHFLADLEFEFHLLTKLEFELKE